MANILERFIPWFPRSRKRWNRISNNLINTFCYRLHRWSKNFIRVEYSQVNIFIKGTTTRELYLRAWPNSVEPLTVKWLEELEEEDILFDIGANVGVFSLIAASYARSRNRRVRVFSFEPHFATFSALQENVIHNQLGEDITPLNIAMGKTDALTAFKLSSLDSGTSGHQLETDSEKPSLSSEYISPIDVMGLSLDSFAEIFSIQPTAIKIDVDGIEEEILRGGETVLQSPLLRTILIENNHQENPAIHEFLIAKGFTEFKVADGPNMIYQKILN